MQYHGDDQLKKDVQSEPWKGDFIQLWHPAQ